MVFHASFLRSFSMVFFLLSIFLLTLTGFAQAQGKATADTAPSPPAKELFVAARERVLTLSHMEPCSDPHGRLLQGWNQPAGE